MGNCSAKPKEVPDVGVGPPSELTLMKKAELKRVLDADGIKRQVRFCVVRYHRPLSKYEFDLIS